MGTNRDSDCPFCHRLHEEPETLLCEQSNLVSFEDIHPVNPGHSLIVPRAHITAFEDLPEAVGDELVRLIDSVIDDRNRTYDPDGYNVGMNLGAAAGQTIDHLHWHVIPRYDGDVAAPEGGVRGVIPEKQQY